MQTIISNPSPKPDVMGFVDLFLPELKGKGYQTIFCKLRGVVAFSEILMAGISYWHDKGERTDKALWGAPGNKYDLCFAQDEMDMVEMDYQKNPESALWLYTKSYGGKKTFFSAYTVFR